MSFYRPLSFDWNKCAVLVIIIYSILVGTLRWLLSLYFLHLPVLFCFNCWLSLTCFIFLLVFVDDDGTQCFPVLPGRQRKSSSIMLLAFLSKNFPIVYSFVIIQSFDVVCAEWRRASSNNTRHIGAIVSYLAPSHSRDKLVFASSCCPSVRMCQLGSHWTGFRENFILDTFIKNLSIKFKFG